ncbi:PREDICTED: uncharacterized protein C3orf20-like [Chinchilla lanigera]|uniref:uncharacterized protein C3orf20-like n=1 Tax=Chinchilla lanigera TaxID=34839 RepID=UPI0006989084|nr:PREDICTED: uncharacterized protein C3orf20-like [Chinchilla lanigera]
MEFALSIPLRAEDWTRGLAPASHKKKNLEGLKQAEVTIAASCEKHELCPHITSEPPSLLRVPPSLKLSKIHLQKCLFEEYKRVAPETLGELEKMLQTYAERSVPLPVGLINLVNDSWPDLAAGTPEHGAHCKQGWPAARGDLKQCKASSDSREDSHKAGQLATAKQEARISASKSVKKLPLASHDHDAHLENSSLDVIHFLTSSQICLENGWLFQRPYSRSEILKWNSVLGAAVERLQEALARIKTEKAQLKREGLNRGPILCYYGEPEGEEERPSPQATRSLWLELLERRPQLLTTLEAEAKAEAKAGPLRRKFHCALADGSSVTYYPSGRLAVCQSPWDPPWGGAYTNIFSDLPSQPVLGTFTPFGCGSVSSQRQIFSMMFNPDGGLVMSRSGRVLREWMWPEKGKLKDPIEVGVNSFITVKISGRFAITLVYRCDPQSLKLALAPQKCKPGALGLPGAPLPAVNLAAAAEGARDSLGDCQTRWRLGLTAQNTVPAGAAEPGDADGSPLRDAGTTEKLRALQSRARRLLLGWQNRYRRALGTDALPLPPRPVRKQRAPWNQDAWVGRGALETEPLCDSSGAPRPRRLPRTRTRTRMLAMAVPRCPRPLPLESRAVLFVSQLLCPVVLRRTLQGQQGDICRCSAHHIPEVTDLEYDRLILEQLCSSEQTVVVYVSSATDKERTVRELAQVYRELNRARTMPCIQSHLDAFRLLRYNLTSTSKLTGSDCPLLVRRHNIVPGIFLMYIRGKLLFANFIFNGYSTSARDLQKQIVKTRNDYLMGYFLPSDFRIRA